MRRGQHDGDAVLSLYEAHARQSESGERNVITRTCTTESGSLISPAFFLGDSTGESMMGSAHKSVRSRRVRTKLRGDRRQAPPTTTRRNVHIVCRADVWLRTQKGQEHYQTSATLIRLATPPAIVYDLVYDLGYDLGYDLARKLTLAS